MLRTFKFDPNENNLFRVFEMILEMTYSKSILDPGVRCYLLNNLAVLTKSSLVLSRWQILRLFVGFLLAEFAKGPC